MCMKEQHRNDCRKKKRPPVLDWTGGVWIISPKKIHVIFIDVGGGERGEAWGGREGRIMQEGRVRSIRGPYIIHSGKSISGEYSGVRCEHQPLLLHPRDLSCHVID